MLRLAIASALLALLVSGCGSDADNGDSPADSNAEAEPGDSSASSSDARYFERTDSDVINKTAAAAQQALAKAYAPKTQRACNAKGADGYAAWRQCWHLALDPVDQRLGSLASEMERLARNDFPQACTEKLTAAASTFTDMRRKVSLLLTGIDSDQRASQKKALGDYDRDLLAIGKGFAPVFQGLTQVCYSPKDLASINASPSPEG